MFPAVVAAGPSRHAGQRTMTMKAPAPAREMTSAGEKAPASGVEGEAMPCAVPAAPGGGIEDRAAAAFRPMLAVDALQLGDRAPPPTEPPCHRPSASDTPSPGRHGRRRGEWTR